MKKTDDNVKLVIRLLYDNNPDGILRALAENGILVPDKKDIKAVLFTLYISDPKRWEKVVRSISFNPSADNYTTNKEFLQFVNELVLKKAKKAGSVTARTADVAKFEMPWQSIIDGVIGTDESSTTTTTETKPAEGSLTTKILISIGIFGALVAIIYFVTKSPKIA